MHLPCRPPKGQGSRERPLSFCGAPLGRASRRPNKCHVSRSSSLRHPRASWRSHAPNGQAEDPSIHSLPTLGTCCTLGPRVMPKACFQHAPEDDSRGGGMRPRSREQSSGRCQRARANRLVRQSFAARTRRRLAPRGGVAGANQNWERGHRTTAIRNKNPATFRRPRRHHPCRRCDTHRGAWTIQPVRFPGRGPHRQDLPRLRSIEMKRRHDGRPCGCYQCPHSSDRWPRNVRELLLCVSRRDESTTDSTGHRLLSHKAAQLMRPRRTGVGGVWVGVGARGLVCAGNSE
jgi:hypothetical protein